MTPLPLLQQREIEANVLAPVFRAFAAELGGERARAILAGVVRELATQAGCAAAANFRLFSLISSRRFRTRALTEPSGYLPSPSSSPAGMPVNSSIPSSMCATG